jgi:hypothetical protein
MGTVWFFASSMQTSEDIAFRAIVGGSICIIGVLLLHVLTRKHIKANYIYYACIIWCVTIVSFILLAGAIHSITMVGVAL